MLPGSYPKLRLDEVEAMAESHTREAVASDA
jgi:hypothetical protein